MNRTEKKTDATSVKAPTKIRKRVYILCGVLLFLLVLIAWIVWGNVSLMVSEITVTSDRLPQSFSGFRVAQISDLHNATFGKNNSRLVAHLKETEPDILVITGDLVDSNHTNVEVALSFAQQAVDIAPTYYVNGNHEARLDEYTELKEGLEAAGVMVLENEKVEIERAGAHICLAGVNDPSFEIEHMAGDASAGLRAALDGLLSPDDTYTVLLSHRPELFDVYVESQVDLVFTGHAHGGQFRLPFVGGVVAPGQGLFPQYDAGVYTEENTHMIVSRGIGNSIIPFRIHNRPEIVVVELRRG